MSEDRFWWNTGAKCSLRAEVWAAENWWQTVCWLKTINCPTGNCCDSLDDTVLVPKCCSSWIRREKYICRNTKNTSASLMPAWQKDISSRCTYAAGTGLAEKTLCLQRSSSHSKRQLKIACTTQISYNKARRTYKTISGAFFTHAAVYALFFCLYTSQEMIGGHNF